MKSGTEATLSSHSQTSKKQLLNLTDEKENNHYPMTTKYERCYCDEEGLTNPHNKHDHEVNTEHDKKMYRVNVRNLQEGHYLIEATDAEDAEEQVEKLLEDGDTSWQDMHAYEPDEITSVHPYIPPTP